MGKKCEKKETKCRKRYIGHKGKLYRSKKLKKGCEEGCRYKCHKNVSADMREKLFYLYWGFGDITLQRQMLFKYAHSKSTKQRTTTGMSRRSCTISWSLPLGLERVQVCKTFFLHTLNISDQMIKTALKKQLVPGVISPYGRGRHYSRPKKITGLNNLEVQQHIESFATIESHYCRKHTNKKYLPPNLSLTKMYDLYLEDCIKRDTGVLVKLSYYLHIFNTEFSLAFHHPVKDQCDLCVSYNSNENQKQAMQSTYHSHVANKKAARENK